MALDQLLGACARFVRLSGMTAVLRIEGLAKRFPPVDGGTASAVFEDVWFNLAAGEFVCLVGHSGCGKTTILNVLAGLDAASAGAVLLNNREITGPSLDRAVIFQSHALMPWMSVERNIALRCARAGRIGRRPSLREHCRRYIALVGLTGAETKRPAQLSGGMKQRVGNRARARDRAAHAADGRAVQRARRADPAAACRTRSRGSAPRPGRPCS